MGVGDICFVVFFFSKKIFSSSVHNGFNNVERYLNINSSSTTFCRVTIEVRYAL